MNKKELEPQKFLKEKINQDLWRKMKSISNCAIQLLGINYHLLQIMLAKVCTKIISKFECFTNKINSVF